MPSLTQQAQDALRRVIRPGDIVIDATAGNGHDTRFLAEQVGSTGRVYAFDVQRDALEQTERRLPAELRAAVTLLQHDHARLADVLPVAEHGRMAAVMFNLGYLPGGDHRVITQTASTLAALEAARDWLRPGGMLSVIAYPGHAGGAEETRAVSDWFTQQEALKLLTRYDTGTPPAPPAPCWFAAWKQGP